MFSDQVKPLVPEWANQELKQESCPRKNGLVEGWFPLSDQSGISCNLMESMRLFDCLSRCASYDFILVQNVCLFCMCRLLHAAPEEERAEELSDAEQDLTNCLSELYESSTAGSNGNQRSKKREYIKQYL